MELSKHLSHLNLMSSKWDGGRSTCCLLFTVISVVIISVRYQFCITRYSSLVKFLSINQLFNFVTLTFYLVLEIT